MPGCIAEPLRPLDESFAAELQSRGAMRCSAGHAWARIGAADFVLATWAHARIWCMTDCNDPEHKHFVSVALPGEFRVKVRECATAAPVEVRDYAHAVELFGHGSLLANAFREPQQPAPCTEQDVDDRLTGRGALAEHNRQWAQDALRTPMADWCRPHAYKVAILAVQEEATLGGLRLTGTELAAIGTALRAAWRAR